MSIESAVASGLSESKCWIPSSLLSFRFLETDVVLLKNTRTCGRCCVCTAGNSVVADFPREISVAVVRRSIPNAVPSTSYLAGTTA